MGWEFKSNGDLKFKLIFKNSSIGSSLCLWNSQYLLVGLRNNIGIIDLSPLDKNEEKEESNERSIRSRLNDSDDDDRDEEIKKSEIEVIKILPCDNYIRTIKIIENKNYIVSQTSNEKILIWK
jgi:hypothetical protein